MTESRSVAHHFDVLGFALNSSIVASNADAAGSRKLTSGSMPAAATRFPHAPDSRESLPRSSSPINTGRTREIRPVAQNAETFVSLDG